MRGKIKSKKIIFGLVVVLCSLLVLCAHSIPVLATAGVNQEIDFEGKVANTNGTNINGSTATPYNMEFKIYSGTSNTGSGDTLLFTEDWLVGSSQGGVSITNGTFNVNIGAAGSGDSVALSTINFNQYPLWLSMNVGSTSTCATTFVSCGGGDGEMTPYIQFDSAPYALNAGEVGGLSSSSLVQLTPSSQQTGTINVSGNIQSAGTVQANTVDAASSGNLTVGSSNATGIILNTNTTLTNGKTLTAGGQTVISGTGIIQPAAVAGSYTGITGLGTITAGTWQASTLNPAYGGTGQSSYTIGDLLYASASTTLSELHDVPTGSCLISGGSAVAPVWGSCGSSGSGANTALSNLASVALNTSLLPATTNSINIGSAALTFSNGYFGTALQSPLLDSVASGTLGLGTSNATTITIGSTSGTAATVGINSGANLNLGNNSVNKTINVGSTGSGAYTTALNLATSTGASQTIDIGGTGTSGGSASGTTLALQAGAVAQNMTTSGDTIQTYTNSTTAFEIQNANSLPIFVVDTATTSNLLTNPGFEAGITGWSANGTGAAIAKNTNKAYVYNGLSSLQVTTGTTANAGSQTTSFIGGSPATGTYTLSFYAMGSTNLTGLTASLGTGTCTLNSTTISNSGFQRYYCSVTTTAATTAITFTVATTSATFYMDAVQLISGSSLTPYQIGAIQLRGIVDNPVTLEATSNSTTALQVENSTAVNLLYVDSVNNVIQIGSQTASTNGIILALNNYNGSLGTEPAEVNGAMYYNSTINQLRCGVNGAWENCSGLDIANTATAACTVTITATACAPNNYFTSAAPTIPANYCTTGRVIQVYASGIYTGTTAASTLTFSIRLGSIIIGAASPALASGAVAGMQWNVNFDITCDSTTTVTGEGTATVFASATGTPAIGQMTGTATTAVTNTSAQTIEPYVNVGTAADFTSITLEQLVVSGM
jgi:hypothetical protein